MHLGAFVHLSDLHFGKHIADPNIFSRGHIYWAGMTQGVFKMQPHNRAILNQLEKDIDSIKNTLGYDEFDGWFVTGDILTYPYGKKNFDDFAYSYLTATIEKNPGSGKSDEIGLKIPKRKLFCVPGNHDKMLLKDLGIYESSKFYRKPHKPCDYICKVDGHNGQVFVIVGFDSNFYDHPALAVGNLREDSQTRQIKVIQKMKTLESGGRVDGIQLSQEQYKESIKIALLHHGLVAHPGPTYLYHQLFDRPRHLSNLSPYFDVFLYGHFHQFAFTPHANSFLIACGSTSQFYKNKKKNSLNILTFEEKDKGKYVVVRNYLWNKKHFVEDKLEEELLPNHSIS